jgi:hypothetical protein
MDMLLQDGFRVTAMDWYLRKKQEKKEYKYL